MHLLQQTFIIACAILADDLMSIASHAAGWVPGHTVLLCPLTPSVHLPPPPCHGQTFIIACAMLTHNLMSIASHASGAVRDSHLFSAYLVLPLAGCTLGLLVHNW